MHIASLRPGARLDVAWHRGFLALHELVLHRWDRQRKQYKQSPCQGDAANKDGRLDMQALETYGQGTQSLRRGARQAAGKGSAPQRGSLGGRRGGTSR
jgi:hypothetical protein